MYAIPEASRLHQEYKDDGVRVLGLAAAFEDFDKNSLDNPSRQSDEPSAERATWKG